ncbi:fructose-bisphosphate aldolase class I [Candidatus Kaiserbacteria bacterium]|nr:fructose-bisphosphate aldolase class I [Candidatus Kaiserbacteria bacterium]
MSDSKALHKIAKSLVVPRKGILAADQSPGSMNKQLAALDIPETPEMRRKYRQLLFTTPGIEEYVTGVIMHDGTIRNYTDERVQFSDVLISKGIIPIIKVDTGTVPHNNFPGEVVTQGLDGLEGRLREYYDMGARAAKWRAVITISDDTPTLENLRTDSMSLARYAAMCQSVGIVPMVEPEVLYAGSHSLERAEAVTTETLKILFTALKEQRVDLSGLILKSSMVLAGSEYNEQSSPREVAEASLRTYKNSVPEEVPGIVFLSGGQTPERATENLNAIAMKEKEVGGYPWEFAFSYSRGLEQPVQQAWLGDDKNVKKAQEALLNRLRLNSMADSAEYTASME